MQWTVLFWTVTPLKQFVQQLSNACQTLTVDVNMLNILEAGVFRQGAIKCNVPSICVKSIFYAFCHDNIAIKHVIKILYYNKLYSFREINIQSQIKGTNKTPTMTSLCKSSKAFITCESCAKGRARNVKYNTWRCGYNNEVSLLIICWTFIEHACFRFIYIFFL